MDTPYFPGQQTDERVLYVVRPHVYGLYVGAIKVVGLAIFLLVVMLMLAKFIALFVAFGLILSGLVAIIGLWVVITMYEKSVAYITDRRVVRFEAATPFATNTRSLAWDQVAKIKTFPRNVLMKILMVGTVTVHSGSTYVHTHEQTRENVYTNDDLELENVFYYKDLGNYLDKLLYMYKTKPEELATMRPFVPKPAGQRY